MDLKEFLISRSLNLTAYKNCNPKNEVEAVPIEQLGLFFWERGGKQFVKETIEWVKSVFEDMEDKTNYKKNFVQIVFDYTEDAYESIIDCFDYTKDGSKAHRDFLDALACFGEDKVKELIKELSENGKQ